MITLRKPRPSGTHCQHKDVCKIVSILYEAGYIVDYHDAAWAWEEYSADCYAGWLCVLTYSGDAIVRIMRQYLDGDPNEDVL